MTPEEKELMGIDKISSGKSPITGQPIISSRSIKWWISNELCQYGRKEAENEDYIEYSVRYLIRKKSEPRAAETPMDEVIKEREDKFKEITNK